MSKGLLLILSGPSGVGKGRIREQLLQEMPELIFAVSATTRAPRPGEIDGVHYYFLDESEFQRRVEAGDFVEWAEVYGNRYGTPGAPIRRWLEEGKEVILEKDVQGARTLRRVFPDGVLVFILPPSQEELWRRQEGRGTEGPGEMTVRRQAAGGEVASACWYDYLVVNDDLRRAVDKVKAIITAERCRATRCLGEVQNIDRA